MTWMITITGREHHFSTHNDMEPGVLVQEVASALAQINRFTGHCIRPYSVAEHSLLVADLARQFDGSATAQLAALLHDAHEAFVGDVSSPVKWHVGPAWELLETSQMHQAQNALRVRLASHAHRAQIRRWDLMALATERRDLTTYQPGINKPWAILDNPGDQIYASPHHKLNTPEREAMTWRDWRDAFGHAYAELSGAVARELEAMR